MASKPISMITFLTEEDEDMFSILLKEHIPQLKFIVHSVWDTPNPPVYDSIAECRNHRSSHIIFIDTHIMSINEYKNTCIYPHPAGSGYLGEQCGSGLIQFERSRVGRYRENCLGSGSLATTYDAKEERKMDFFVKTVWRLVKKNALKVHLIDRDTGSVSEKPESRFYAFPDAAATFNGNDNCYLTCGALASFIVIR